VERYGFIEECIKLLEKDALDTSDAEKLFLVRKASVELLQLTSSENDEEVIQGENTLVTSDQNKARTKYDFRVLFDSNEVRAFVELANEQGYDIISLLRDNGVYTVLYKEKV